MAISVSALLAHAQAPSFEAASVKPNTSGNARGLGGPQLGHFVQTATLARLIQMANGRGGFDVRPVVGGPNWIDTDRFDINAAIDPSLSRAQLYLPDGKGSPGLAYLMLRTLLADRFKLVVHRETRQLPIYVLVHPGSQLGSRLRGSDVDCVAVLAEVARNGRGMAPISPNQGPPCSTQSGPMRVVGRDISMAQLAEVLSQSVDREVHDGTALTGNYSLTLEWSDDLSVFTAIQEQLGLKLQAARGPVEVVVVDRAERPTPD